MFWNIREGAPILSTLWFLRDLIVMIAITPIFYFLARIIDWLLPLGLLAIYLFVKIPVDGISGTALFFFGTGSWMAIKHAGGGKILVSNLSNENNYSDMDIYLGLCNAIVLNKCNLLWKNIRDFSYYQ